jgi:hypothetical protein
MDVIFSEIFRAVGYLFIAGGVITAWKLSRDYARKHNLKAALWKGFLCCVGIAFFSAITLGDPTCVGGDPLYGGCDSYEGGYDPTQMEQYGSFAYMFTLLYVPAVIGALNGGGKSPKERVEGVMSELKKETDKRLRKDEEVDKEVWKHTFSRYKTRIKDIFE